MNEDLKKEYLKKLSTMLEECLEDPSQKHGLLIISNGISARLSIYSINADEPMLQHIMASAAHLIFPPAGENLSKTVN